MRVANAFLGNTELQATRRPRRASAMATFDSAPPMPISSAPADSIRCPRGVDKRIIVSPKLTRSKSAIAGAFPVLAPRSGRSVDDDRFRHTLFDLGGQISGPLMLFLQ